MKPSGGSLLLLLLALAVFIAMIITLWFGGERSRHGYGLLPSQVTTTPLIRG